MFSSVKLFDSKHFPHGLELWKFVHLHFSSKCSLVLRVVRMTGNDGEMCLTNMV